MLDKANMPIELSNPARMIPAFGCDDQSACHLISVFMALSSLANPNRLRESFVVGGSVND